MSLSPFPLLLVMSALALGGCGDKGSEEAEEADTDTDTDTDTDADTDADTDTDADFDPVDLSLGCLNQACDLPAAAATAVALCDEAIEALGGAASYPVVELIEQRQPEAPGSVRLTCDGLEFDEAACSAHCDRAGLLRVDWSSVAGRCDCYGQFEEQGALLDELGAIACPDGLRRTQLSVRRGATEETTLNMEYAAVGDTEGDCGGAMDLANTSLKSSFTEWDASSSGCELSY